MNQVAGLPDLSTFDTLPLAVIATDLDGVIFYANAEAELLYGHPHDHLIHAHVVDILVHALDSESALEIFATVLAGHAGLIDAWDAALIGTDTAVPIHFSGSVLADLASRSRTGRTR